ncbi:MAG: YggT family protein [Pyrinomonadaceae bacterium]
MSPFQSIGILLWYAVVTLIVAVIALMLLRYAINYADINPFSRTALFIRRFSDPLVNPVRGKLMGFGFDPKFAPLVTILVTILVGYFFLQLAGNVLFTLDGIVKSLLAGRPLMLIGYLLYGLLAVYSLLIIMRVIFSWVVSYSNPVMRFLTRATDPILIPARRIIPPIGMMDISPIIVIFMLQLFQGAIAGTLL